MIDLIRATKNVALLTHSQVGAVRALCTRLSLRLRSRLWGDPIHAPNEFLYPDRCRRLSVPANIGAPTKLVRLVDHAKTGRLSAVPRRYLQSPRSIEQGCKPAVVADIRRTSLTLAALTPRTPSAFIAIARIR
jgi:hypothetical protein